MCHRGPKLGAAAAMGAIHALLVAATAISVRESSTRGRKPTTIRSGRDEVGGSRSDALAPRVEGKGQGSGVVVYDQQRCQT